MEKEKLECELQDLLSQKEELDQRLGTFQSQLTDTQADHRRLFGEFNALSTNIENMARLTSRWDTSEDHVRNG